jgi:hypothetical protein
MLDAFHVKEVALNVNDLSLNEVAKYKQSSI